MMNSNTINNHDIKSNKTEYFIYLCLALGAIAILLPMLSKGVWPATHESNRYLDLLHFFKDAFANGIIYPRWLPYLYGGYGSPLFVYYQPGIFYASLPFMLIFDNAQTAMQITLLIMLFSGALGVFKVVDFQTDRLTAIYCAFLFLLTPYFFSNIYVRGDLSELCAILLTPWHIYFFLQIQYRQKNSLHIRWQVIYLSLFTGLIIVFHPIIAMFYLSLFVVFSLYLIHKSNEKKLFFFLIVGFALLSGIMLVTTYWHTTLYMAKYVQIERAFTDFYSAYKHTVHPMQLLERKWGFGGSMPDSFKDGMSFQLGLPHFLVAVFGAWFGRKRAIIQVSFMLYVTSIAIMTPLFGFIWKVPLISNAQFPWRLLSITALIQVILASGIADSFFRSGKKKVLVFLTILVATTLWYSDMFTINTRSESYKIVNIKQLKSKALIYPFSYTTKNEFLPKTITSISDIRLPLIFLPTKNGYTKLLPNHTRYNILFELYLYKPTKLIISQFYLPGWKISINKKFLSRQELENNLNELGLITLSFSKPGKYVVTAYYEGPPGWKARIVIFFLAVFLLTGFFIYEKNRYRYRP